MGLYEKIIFKITPGDSLYNVIKSSVIIAAKSNPKVEHIYLSPNCEQNNNSLEINVFSTRLTKGKISRLEVTNSIWDENNFKERFIFKTLREFGGKEWISFKISNKSFPEGKQIEIKRYGTSNEVILPKRIAESNLEKYSELLNILKVKHKIKDKNIKVKHNQIFGIKTNIEDQAKAFQWALDHNYEATLHSSGNGKSTYISESNSDLFTQKGKCRYLSIDKSKYTTGGLKKDTIFGFEYYINHRLNIMLNESTWKLSFFKD